MTDPTDRLAEIEASVLALLEERAALLAGPASPARADAFEHERRVIATVDAWADGLGFGTTGLGEALARFDLAATASVVPPATTPSPTTGPAHPEPRTEPQGTALVVGGGGRMGGWMARFLARTGWDVTVADPSGTTDDLPHVASWRDTTLAHDLVVVAAPLRPSNAILHELAEARPSGIVFDIGSLKSPLRTGLVAVRDAGLRVTSVHPMFGPDVDLLHGRHVIFVDLGDTASRDATEALFVHTAATRVRMTLDEHDRVIAYILGLSHALNVAFVTAMAESGEAAPRLADMSSTTFEAQLDVARRVVRENPHLYFEIQHLNDYGTEALAALSYAVEKVRSVVRAGDEQGFVRLMEQGNRYVRGR